MKYKFSLWDVIKYVACWLGILAFIAVVALFILGILAAVS